MELKDLVWITHHCSTAIYFTGIFTIDRIVNRTTLSIVWYIFFSLSAWLPSQCAELLGTNCKVGKMAASNGISVVRCFPIRYVPIRYFLVRYFPVRYLLCSLCPRMIHPWKLRSVRKTPSLIYPSPFVSYTNKKGVFQTFFPWYLFDWNRQKYYWENNSAKYSQSYLTLDVVS